MNAAAMAMDGHDSSHTAKMRIRRFWRRSSRPASTPSCWRRENPSPKAPGDSSALPATVSASANASPLSSRPSGLPWSRHRAAWRWSVLRCSANQAALSARTGAISRSCASSNQVAPRRCSARTRWASTSGQMAALGKPLAGIRQPINTCPRMPLSVISWRSTHSRSARWRSPVCAATLATVSA